MKNRLLDGEIIEYGPYKIWYQSKTGHYCMAKNGVLYKCTKRIILITNEVKRIKGFPEYLESLPDYGG